MTGGHNCPHKDRSRSRQDNQVVFYMSNMTPQKHGMNGGPWEIQVQGSVIF